RTGAGAKRPCCATGISRKQKSSRNSLKVVQAGDEPYSLPRSRTATWVFRVVVVPLPYHAGVRRICRCHDLDVFPQNETSQCAHRKTCRKIRRKNTCSR